jgi:hypothetical protein
MQPLSPQFDLDLIPLSAIQLGSDQLDQALIEAEQINPSPANLWQTYLTILAQIGFTQWIQERAPDLPLSPRTSSAPPIVRSFQIRDFQLTLLATAGDPDQWIELPESVMDNSSSHFYVLSVVHEEQGMVVVYGFLRQDQLVQQRAHLVLDSDRSYQVPLTWFDADPDVLLLYLRCAEAAAFETVARPSLVQNLTQNLAQRVLNTALWLEGEMDAIAQQLSWVLLPALPPPQFKTAMRSNWSDSDGNHERLIRTLQERGVNIPSSLRPAYRDLTIGQQSARLYALPWQLEAPAGESLPPAEWSLVVILGPIPGHSLPRDSRLTVTDQTTVLVETQLAIGSTDDYLFAELVGGVDEVFGITVQLGTDVMEVLPAFGFQESSSAIDP